MDKLGQVLKEAAKRLGRKVTQIEISDFVGVSQGHLSNVVLGRQKASDDLLESIVEYLNQIDSSHTYTFDEVRSETAPSTNRYAKQLPNQQFRPIKIGEQMISLPQISHVPCGNFESITTAEVEEWHLIPKSLVGSAKIAVRAVGDSMAPKIMTGDLLLVEEVSVSDVSSDDVVIADIDGELGCKRLAKFGDNIVLNSDNPAYSPIHLSGGQAIKIVGRVVGLHRKF